MQADGCPGLRFAGDMDNKSSPARHRVRKKSVSQSPSSSGSSFQRAVRHEGCGGVSADPHTHNMGRGAGGGVDFMLNIVCVTGPLWKRQRPTLSLSLARSHAFSSFFLSCCAHIDPH